MKKILFPYLCLLLLSSSFVAQEQSVDDLQKKVKTIKAKNEIYVVYDKFKNQSSIVSKPYNVVSGKESFLLGMVDALERGPYGSKSASPATFVLLTGLVVTFEGDKLTKIPETYGLMFTSGSNEWMFLKGDSNLYFIIDGTRKEFKSIGADRDINRGSVTEQMGYALSRSDVQQIVDAKVVEFRLGNTNPRQMPSKLQKRFKHFLAITQIN